MAELSQHELSHDNPDQSPMNPLFARLRAETSVVHRELESVVDVVRPDLTVDGYRSFLVAQLGFHRPLEARFSRHEGLAAAVPDYPRRKKSHLLEDDLVALGMSVDQVRSLPQLERLPALDSLEQMLGALYVLEGSTLGGQFLVRHVGSVLPHLVPAATHFLDAYGRETGAMWKSFRNHVAAAATQLDQDALVRSATATFAAIKSWFVESGGTRAQQVSIVGR